MCALSGAAIFIGPKDGSWRLGFSLSLTDLVRLRRVKGLCLALPELSTWS